MGIYKLSQVSFNTESFTLAAGNREIYIGPLATKLLFYMLEHSGKTLSRDDLAYSVWGYPAKDHTITQAVTSLRSHLSTLDKNASRCIVTVPKKGYRLRLDNGTKIEKDYTPQYFRPSAMKFLVVDDHPFIRKVHSELLVQLESAAVDTCASAETALERLNSVSYDCVFADLEMENMNGLDLVKWIRMGKIAGLCWKMRRDWPLFPDTPPPLPANTESPTVLPAQRGLSAPDISWRPACKSGKVTMKLLITTYQCCRSRSNSLKCQCGQPLRTFDGKCPNSW